jgi:hypothetical protein
MHKHEIESMLNEVNDDIIMATLDGNENALAELQKRHSDLFRAWEESAGF